MVQMWVEPSEFHRELIDFLVKADFSIAFVETPMIKQSSINN